MRFLVYLIVSFLTIATHAEEPAPVIRIEDALNFPTSEYKAQRRFDFIGQALTDNDTYFIFSDQTGNTFLENSTPKDCDFKQGDLIQVGGHLFYDDHHECRFRALNLKVLGHKRISDPVEIDGGQITRADLLYSHVRIKGVISSAVRDELDSRYNCIALRTKSGVVNASVPDKQHPLKTLQHLIDADVSIRGFVIPYSSWRRNLGTLLFMDDPNSITVHRNAVTDCFSAPDLTSTDIIHRQKAEGAVIATCANRFFIRTKDRECLQVKPEPDSPLPQAGQWVIAVGFAEMDPFNLRLVNAIVKVNPAQTLPLPAAESADPERMFANPLGQEEVDADKNGKILRLRGVVQYLPGVPTEMGTMNLICGKRIFNIDVSAAIPNAEKIIGSGSTVEVSGLCLAEFENDSPQSVFPRFKRFTIVPQNADDIVILKHPQWWTPLKFFLVIGTLFAVIIVILIWNRALKRLSEHRGRQLLRERIAHVETHLKVVERTRLAVELHDSIAQNLTGVAFAIDSAKDFAKNNRDEMDVQLDVAARTLKSCRDELRNCLWDLRNNALEESDMNTAIRRTLDPHVNGVGIAVRFNVPRERFTDNTAHAVLSIIRELTANAIRHGHATKVMIAGSAENNKLLFSVKDNGYGFDPENRPGIEQGHFGIQGVCERVDTLEGEMDIASAPGNGTKVTISLRTPTFSS